MGSRCSSIKATTAIGVAGATLALVAAFVALTDDPGSSAVPAAILWIGTALGSASCGGCCLSRLLKRRAPTPERAATDDAAPGGSVPDADNPYARS